MVTKILVITGSGNSLVNFGAKPLPNSINTEPSKLHIWYSGFEGTGTLIYRGLVTPYGNNILVSIGSVNGLSPVWC